MAGQKCQNHWAMQLDLTEPADQVFGKLMSISDELMWHYMHILLYKTDAEIAKLKKQIADDAVHPMDLKKSMAHAIVARFWSSKEADAAQAQFEALFQKKDYSQAVEVSIEHKEDLDC